MSIYPIQQPCNLLFVIEIANAAPEATALAKKVNGVCLFRY